MSGYKIVYDADGNEIAWGPNTEHYEPYVAEGCTLVLSDSLPGQSTGQLFADLRAERDTRLLATDKYLLPDYPITADVLEQIKAYRAALRALPDQPGAPWPDGDIPWPKNPMD